MNKDQLAELEMLRTQNGGVLLPAAILDFARSANTALHAAFSWDDTEAAERWRVHQAKQVIRAAVTMLPRPDGAMVPVRAYVFSVERGGYAATSAVISDDAEAAALMRQMRLDVERALSRYRRHASLVPHIEAAMGALRDE